MWRDVATSVTVGKALDESETLQHIAAAGAIGGALLPWMDPRLEITTGKNHWVV